MNTLSSQHASLRRGGWCDLHAPRDSIRWIMEGYNEGISLCSDLIPIVVGYFGTHDAIMDRRCNLHDLQTATPGHSQVACTCLSCGSDHILELNLGADAKVWLLQKQRYSTYSQLLRIKASDHREGIKT